MKVVSIVGMAGSGKSEVAKIFEQSGYTRVRFGDITDEEIRKRGLDLNEKNERIVRESLRKEHGMVAYAKLNLPRIEAARRTTPVALDGLYSWEEYLFFKDYYKEDFFTVAVWASPKTRYARLGSRLRRPLTLQEAVSRDRSEIENVNKGGPIAVADFTIINEVSLAELKEQTRRVLAALA